MSWMSRTEQTLFLFLGSDYDRWWWGIVRNAFGNDHGWKRANQGSIEWECSFKRMTFESGNALYVLLFFSLLFIFPQYQTVLRSMQAFYKKYIKKKKSRRSLTHFYYFNSKFDSPYEVIDARLFSSQMPCCRCTACLWDRNPSLLNRNYLSKQTVKTYVLLRIFSAVTFLRLM